MRTQTIILEERTGRWAAALSLQSPAGVVLVQTRGYVQCAAEVVEAPASLVALELTGANALQVADLTSAIVRRHPWATVVILADDDAGDADQLAREAGATHVFHSPRALDGFSETLERHFRRLPRPRREFAAAVWDSLPWNHAARA